MAVSQLSLLLRPRYHFAGQQGAFYERQPYRNHRVLTDLTKHVTRFIGIARLGNAQKKKVSMRQFKCLEFNICLHKTITINVYDPDILCYYTSLVYIVIVIVLVVQISSCLVPHNFSDVIYPIILTFTVS